MTQVLDHLGRGHQRGGVQVHRALSFLGTGHTRILSSSLQENVRTLLSTQNRYLRKTCENCVLSMRGGSIMSPGGVRIDCADNGGIAFL